jgi:hypothetical protein
MKNVKHQTAILIIVCFLLTIGSQSALAATNDGKYYFTQLKQSIHEIIGENQKLINTNPDGSQKSKKLTPKAIYKKTYEMFKKIIGSDFKMKHLKGETDPAKIAPVLSALLQSGRITIAKSQKTINTEADGSAKKKKFIPAVFGKQVIDRFIQKTGIHMKQTTLGKNGFKNRNPYNAPNEWETAFLNKVMAPGWPLNQGIGEVKDNQYLFLKPIYIKKGCLPCHGTPVGEKGPYGSTKEGYKTGDIRGGISIAMPIK